MAFRLCRLYASAVWVCEGISLWTPSTIVRLSAKVFAMKNIALRVEQYRSFSRLLSDSAGTVENS